MAGKDYYAALGVSKTATEKEIKKAYRRLARKHHPDVNPDDKTAEEQFKLISEAHDVLSNPEKRKIYDEFGEDGLRAGFDPEQARKYSQWQQFGGGGGRAAGGQGFYRDFSFEGDSVKYTGFEDMFKDLFGGRAGGGRFSTRGPSRGMDIESSLEVDFLTAIRGETTRVTIQSAPGPDGRSRMETIDVNVPAGVDDGSRIRLTGKGEPGIEGGAPGDLIIKIRVRPHPLLKRDGDSLKLDVPVTVKEAMKGAEIAVPTPGGIVQLKVPPGTKSGQVLRLKGKGVPNLKTKAPGDMFVTIRVEIPSTTAEEALNAADILERYYVEDIRRNVRL
jgi:DnaJ-class molecular chaperone